jgi:geranylgeranyl diphosphate synthase type I
LHNFSLIHDDIEDLSETRHGQSTLWKKYGLAQAINSGDAMFSLAQICILELGKTISPEVAYESSKLVNNTCLFLTGGQYLDMTFEDSLDISSDDYFQMISGKTAALLAASAELGALVSQSSKINRNNLRAFGEALGLAFQAQDDFLGIWGDEAIIGKSTSSDLKSGKKTLPVVYALEKDPSLLAYFKEKPESDFQVRERVAILEKLGAKQYTEKVAKHYNDLALQSLDAVTDGNLEAKQALLELINFLLNRAK